MFTLFLITTFAYSIYKFMVFFIELLATSCTIAQTAGQLEGKSFCDLALAISRHGRIRLLYAVYPVAAQGKSAH